MLSKLQEFEKPVLFVGIGNRDSGDDAIGPEIIKMIKEAKLPLNAIDCGMMPENYFKDIASYRPKTVVFIDAVAMNKAPGTLDLFESDKIESFSVSTHGISLGMIAEYLKAELKTKVYLLGIQPKSIKQGDMISEEVTKTVSKLINTLKELF